MAMLNNQMENPTFHGVNLYFEALHCFKSSYTDLNCRDQSKIEF